MICKLTWGILIIIYPLLRTGFSRARWSKTIDCEVTVKLIKLKEKQTDPYIYFDFYFIADISQTKTFQNEVFNTFVTLSLNASRLSDSILI